MDPFGGGGLFAQLAQGLGGQFAGGPHMRPRPSVYDDYFKAYSVAMLPGKQRDNLSYGGKIIMPPSALANLTSLDIESPWMFKLRNPANPAASTHAGVLEFIAQEGCVHLPYWMMKTLRLNEGDPIRITGAELPKGKFVKLQAQQVDFLQVSDPKATLEIALRNFTTLTQGDIIEITYNSIVFGMLIMETKPGGEGISILDTDLEVDFAAPVGYVEPERPKPAPPSTMASKLKIDVNSTTSTPGTSRPGSSLSGAFAGTTGEKGKMAVSKDGEHWESFKGRGETLSGRKTKGKGVGHRKIEEVTAESKIIRTDRHRIVTNDTLGEDSQVPAPLNLPFGKLFFGFKFVPYVPPEKKETDKTASDPAQPATFAGSGNSLTGRSTAAAVTASAKGKEKEKANEEEDVPMKEWGSGHRLGAKPTYGAGGARAPAPPRRSAPQKQKERSPTPDFGVDDDDIIDIDSD